MSDHDFSPLPASAYKPGDRVCCADYRDRYVGVVHIVGATMVYVRWDGHEYEDTAAHVSSPERLLLQDAFEHTRRVRASRIVAPPIPPFSEV